MKVYYTLNLRFFLLLLFLPVGIGAAISTFSADLPGANESPISIDQPLSGPVSGYTERLAEFAKRWFMANSAQRSALWAKEIKGGGPDVIGLRCFVTPGQEFYVGIAQTMRVDVPFSKVEAVLDDIDHYVEIFPDYKDIKVTARQMNRLTTYWEQRVPVPFIPNVKYEMEYLLGKPSPLAKVYRYQLKAEGTIKRSDGVIVIEQDEASLTRYLEYDFFDADWGVMKTLAPKRIWRESVEGVALSDLGIKLHAEHPDWDGAKVQNEAKKLLDRVPVRECIEKRVPAYVPKID